MPMKWEVSDSLEKSGIPFAYIYSFLLINSLNAGCASRKGEEYHNMFSKMIFDNYKYIIPLSHSLS